MTGNKENKLYYLISALIILGALAVVSVISLFSEYGIHPDEWDVRVCMDWCMNRFIWPDMRLKGEGLGDTFSGYGYTKVCNYTPYFLIFSKVSYVFKQFMDVLPYFRMPNLLLMLLMTVYMLCKLREHSYLMLGFGMCVQAWYIFSYVTADAEDFVLSFFAAAMLADTDSFLWRTLRAAKTDAQTVIRCILLGFLYGGILLGKPYYYVIPVITFIVLIREIIKEGFNNSKEFFARCVMIAGIAFLILGARAALDLHYYGFNKAEAKLQMEIEYTDHDKNPLTPEEDLTPGWKMYSRGYGFTDMLKTEPGWFVKTFRSLAGARVIASGDAPYYLVMLVLYVLIYVLLCAGLIRQGDIFTFITGTILNIGSVVASLVFSYIIEIQPQGRYILPVILTTCFMGSRVSGLWNRRAFRILVLSAGGLSVAYFGLFDLRKLIDLAYVRSLIG